MTNDTEFSTRAGHRLIKNQTSKRVSEDAGDRIVEELQEKGIEIAELSKEFAEAAGRETIRVEDVRKAVLSID
jgi:histone H3/H4